MPGRKITGTTKRTTKKKAAPQTPREKKILEIKKKLLAQRAALLDEAEETRSNELPGQSAFPDLGDQASAETERSFILRLRGRERRLLKKIDEAIERIERGIFGICEKCGAEIDIRRIEARPVTTLCIDCKIEQEEEEKLTEM
jgi:DnaK suppressor protein